MTLGVHSFMTSRGLLKAREHVTDLSPVDRAGRGGPEETREETLLNVKRGLSVQNTEEGRRVRDDKRILS